LAEDLPSEAANGQEALTSIVEFEADADAPAYFDERETMVEAAASSADSETE